MQKRIFACKYVLLYKKQRRSEISSMLLIRGETAKIDNTSELKRNAGTQLILILVSNMWSTHFF